MPVWGAVECSSRLHSLARQPGHHASTSRPPAHAPTHGPASSSWIAAFSVADAASQVEQCGGGGGAGRVSGGWRSRVAMCQPSIMCGGSAEMLATNCWQPDNGVDSLASRKESECESPTYCVTAAVLPRHATEDNSRNKQHAAIPAIYWSGTTLLLSAAGPRAAASSPRANRPTRGSGARPPARATQLCPGCAAHG